MCAGAYRVHEQILPSLRKANIPVRWTDVTVRHTGYVDLALRKKKLERDTKILLEELAQRPHDPFVLFNLGAIAIEREAWQESLGYLCRSTGTIPRPPIRSRASSFALIARAHQMMGNTQAALNVWKINPAFSFDPSDAELWFRKGVLHRHRQESAEAEACWRRILNLRRPDKFCSGRTRAFMVISHAVTLRCWRRNAATALKRCAIVRQTVLADCPGDVEAERQLALLNPIMTVSMETVTERTVEPA